jgi:hypothetical protein
MQYLGDTGVTGVIGLSLQAAWGDEPRRSILAETQRVCRILSQILCFQL